MKGIQIRICPWIKDSISTGNLQMDVSGGGVVNGLLFSQTGDQMADITGIMVVNQNTEFISADAVQFSVTGENFPENMCGIRNILIPTVMSEFIIVVFQVVQVKYKQQKICQFFAPAGIFVVSIPVVAAGQEILFRKFTVESRATAGIDFL